MKNENNKIMNCLWKKKKVGGNNNKLKENANEMDKNDYKYVCAHCNQSTGNMLKLQKSKTTEMTHSGDNIILYPIKYIDEISKCDMEKTQKEELIDYYKSVNHSNSLRQNILKRNPSMKFPKYSNLINNVQSQLDHPNNLNDFPSYINMKQPIVFKKKIVLSSSNQRLLNTSDIGSIYKEDFIQSGYRPTNMPSMYYLRSIFYKNNEMMNIWTHIFATIIFIIFTMTTFYHICNDPEWSDIVDMNYSQSIMYLYPMFFHYITSILVPLFSATAHTFSNKSVNIRHLVFLIDYFVCSLHGLTSATSYKAYSFPDLTIWPKFSYVTFNIYG
ncbi:hypothetical protein A3Q56_06769 [Intoshia linei]|uniref:Uncharacterized protein n=1 Tax=Intoshia linei TaxID=1819745 RepID=A0A177AU15_9BILA|nr:hypothetical protein A3Q56_06769 [Intoshia linei]